MSHPPAPGRAFRTLTCLVFFIFLAGAGCSKGPQSPEDRKVEFPEFGYRYIAPPGWRLIGEELISDSRSLLTVKSFDLVGAKREFVAGLPGSIVPQLEGWTKYFYIVDGEVVSRDTTLGGIPALEVVYPIRIRKEDPPSRAVYYVATRGEILFVLRIVLPPGKADQEWPAVRNLLDSFEFIGQPKATQPFPGPGAELAP